MRHTQPRHKQLGLALLIVLGLVMFLSLIALSSSESQRLSSQIASNNLNVARAQAAADGGVHRMLFELSRPPALDQEANLARWKSNGVPYRITENGVQITVSAQNEAAKIDLNFAAEPLLKSLFVSVGVEEAQADSLVAAIKDWTDADILKRPNGAEADDYRAAGKKTMPSNEFFIAIEELQNVMGVTPQIYLAVAPYLTVHARSAGVDPLTATADLLGRVPGVDASVAATWVQERDAAVREGLPVPAIPFASPYFASGTSAIRVRAEAVTDTGISASRDATVRIGLPTNVSPQFFLWQRAKSGAPGAAPIAPSAPAVNPLQPSPQTNARSEAIRNG
jgi:general secretion pathway protein K